MKCQACLWENNDEFLFCRRCLEPLPTSHLGPGYVTGNFRLILRAAENTYRLELPLSDYYEVLDNFTGLVKANLARIESETETLPRETDLSRQGMQNYLEGLEILHAYRGEEDNTLLLEGLTLIEMGNHQLNTVSGMIEEHGDTSIFTNEIR